MDGSRCPGGSEAVAAGWLTPGQLRGPTVKRLFRNTYVLAGVSVTHEVWCAAATPACQGMR